MSVIVPTLNDAAQLRGLLSCLKGQDAQIICGDGGSKDETRQLLASVGARCIVKEGAGALECTNLAASESDADILLFTASDVRFGSDTILNVQHRFQDAELVGVTGWPVAYDGPVLCRLEYGLYFMLASILNPVRFVASGNFTAIRRLIFEQLGGFEDTYNNDGQMGARLKQLGKTSFDMSLVYYVSARRYNRVGFFEFNRQYLYTLENFLPMPAFFSRLGEQLRIERQRTGGHLS